jgi:hypothetical protein
MEFNYNQFLTENKLTNQSRVKSLFERDMSDQYESLSQEIEDEMDDMVKQGDMTKDERSKAQTELESDNDYLTYGSSAKAIQLLLKKVRKKVNEEEDDDEFQDEPTSKDIKPSKSTDNLSKKQYQLASLLKRKDELVSKFKSNEISIDQYKQMIGNIPQHIKTLSADIETLELQAAGNMDESKSKDIYEASYEALERIDGLVNRRDLELFKNALENITNELEVEGFEPSDIKAYIQRELDEVLGTYK